MIKPDLPGIVALARAGALDEAVRRFAAADVASDDPVAWVVKGRLLKDLALSADAKERPRLYLEAGAAYLRSAELQPATYPLINAATLAILGGNRVEASDLAQRVLRTIEEHPDEPETPYYRAATVAEALLLLGRYEQAQVAFGEAVALAPQAWEDHASTIRQFLLILTAAGIGAAWLDAYRPPRSLHFGGHMSFDPAVAGREPLQAAILGCMEEEKIGFGYGALAAGADIIIAEALLARGAELHAVLPGGPQAFAAASVDPFGEAWRGRFDEVLGRAATVRTIRPFGSPPGPQAIRLADEIAMGSAVMNARGLESEAVQLLVIDPEGLQRDHAGATGQAQRIWAASNRRQHLIRAPREALSGVVPTASPVVEAAAVLAVVAVMPGDRATGRTEQWLEPLRDRIAEACSLSVDPYWAGGVVLFAHERLDEAADLVVTLARSGYRAGADYCAAELFRDPFSDCTRVGVAATAAAEEAARSTPEGSGCVTEDFAAALEAVRSGTHRLEYVGELDGRRGGPAVGLYALR